MGVCALILFLSNRKTEPKVDPDSGNFAKIIKVSAGHSETCALCHWIMSPLLSSASTPSPAEVVSSRSAITAASAERGSGVSQGLPGHVACVPGPSPALHWKGYRRSMP